MSFATIRHYVIVFLLFVFLALIIVSPSLSFLSTRVIGSLNESSDLEGALFHYWYRAYALSRGDPAVFTNIFFYPVGYNLLIAQGLLLNCYISIPFQALFGFPLYFNIMALLITALNGLCGYVLFFYLFKDRVISFFCGFIVFLNPYTIIALRQGQLDNLSVFFMLLFILYFLKTYNEENAYNPYIAFGCFLATVFSYYYFAMFLIFFAVIFLGYEYFSNPTFFEKFRTKQLKTLFVLIAVISAPIFIFYSISVIRGRIPLEFFETLSSFAGSSKNALLISSSAQPSFPFLYTYRNMFSIYVSITLCLTLPLLFFTRKKPVVWILCALFFAVLAMGPFFRFSGMELKGFYSFMHFISKVDDNIANTLPNPLFFLFYKYVPFFSRFFHLYRLVAMVIISVAVLFGYCLLFLKERLRGWKTGFIIVTCFLFCCYTADMWSHNFVKVPFSEISIPRFYQSLAGEGDVAIIDLPFTYSANACLYQMFHRKKVLGGVAENAFFMYPRTYVKFIFGNSFTHYLIDMNKYPIKAPYYSARDLDALRAMGFKYLIVHRLYFFLADKIQPSLALAGKHYTRYINVLEELFGQPVYRDNEIRVYAL